MKILAAKVMKWTGKILMYILIALGALFLIAERLHETTFVNFIRSLM